MRIKMNKVIEQTVQFKGATAAQLFDIFLDPKKHSQLHGAEAKISKKEGDQFSVLGGHLNGKNLLIVPDRMIVQSWRGNVWQDDDLDSILTLVFTDTKTGAQIYLTHSCTPKQFKELWRQVYWEPIREFLDAQD
jgi:activator of HSP90 ATPase